MKTVQFYLSAEVAQSGTLSLPYPTGSVAADFDPAGAHLATCAGAQLTSDGSDFSLTFGGSLITYTHGGSATPLPKGATLYVQLIEFSATDTVTAGAGGLEGFLDIFPATQSKGKSRFKSADNAGDTTTEFVVATQAAARTYTIPDAGEDAEFVMDKGEQSIVLKDLDAGASGVAGTVDVFPSTASKGKLAFAAADNQGDWALTVTNASIATQARTVTIPDPGAAAEFVLTKAAQTIDGAKTFGSAIRNTANIGGVPGTVTAVEYGDGYNHVTVLTVTAAVFVVDVPADAEEVGALIYTFPAGVHQVHSVHMDVTAIAIGDNSNAADLGCGSTLAAGNGTTLQAATDEDFLDGQTISDISDPTAGGESEKSLAADGTVFESADSKLFHINMAGEWTSAPGAGASTVTGTVTIVWSFLGA
jgi:hypothetical protein